MDGFWEQRLKPWDTAAAALILILAGCARQLVQPYDARLLDDAHTLYREASAMIAYGELVSPPDDATRAAIDDPESHDGHATQFRAHYASMLTEVDVMLLRALATQLPATRCCRQPTPCRHFSCSST